MANNYYTFSPSFVPGTKVRSDEMNTQLSGIELGFDDLPSDETSLKRGTQILGTESGSGNAFVVTMTDTRASYQEGDRIYFSATHGNTGAATIDVDTVGAVALVRADGAALEDGDILTDVFYVAVFNASANEYQLIGPTSGYLGDLDDRVDWAEEWAINPEDDPVSVAAGGDDSTTFSSLHWAAKSDDSATAAAASASAASTSETNAAASEAAAAASAAGVNLPPILGGDAGDFLQVNVGETGYDLITFPSASATVEGSIELATQAEVDAGTDTTRAVTPDTLASFSGLFVASSESVSGIIELATQAEVTTGTDDLRAVTPLKLATAVPAASETSAGKAELATQAEVTTGTDDARIVTPLKLATAVPAASETAAGKIEIATQTEVNNGADDARAVTPLKIESFVGAGKFRNRTQPSNGSTTELDSDSLTGRMYYCTGLSSDTTLNFYESLSNGLVTRVINDNSSTANVVIARGSGETAVFFDITGGSAGLTTFDILPGEVWDIEKGINSVYYCSRLGAAGTQIFRKASAETVNNSTTLQTDDDLNGAALLVGGEYLIEAELYFSAVTNTMGIVASLALASGTFDQRSWTATCVVNDGSGGPVGYSGGGYNSGIVATIPPAETIAAKAHVVRIKAYVTVSAAAVLELQWAQQTAIASNLNLLAGTYMTVTKV